MLKRLLFAIISCITMLCSYVAYADQEECESGGDVWYNEECMSQAQYNCESAGGTWDGETCSNPQQECEDNGGEWDGETCSNPQQECEDACYYWADGACTNMTYEEYECSQNGHYWVDGACTNMTYEEYECSQNGYYWADGACTNMTQEQYDCENGGYYWNGSCTYMSQEEYECAGEWDGETCIIQEQCGTGEVEDGNGGCMCDESQYYYGDGGSCTQCDPTSNSSSYGQYWDGSNCQNYDCSLDVWDPQTHRCVTPCPSGNYVRSQDGTYCYESGTNCRAYSSNVINLGEMGVYMHGSSLNTSDIDYMEMPGTGFDFNGNGTIDANECYVARVNVADYDTADNASTDQDILDAGIDVEFCKWNPVTNNYDLACTQRTNVCSITDVGELKENPTTTNTLYTVGDWLNLSQSDLANPSSLFTYTPATAPLYQRCSGESCPSGTTAYDNDGLCYTNCASGATWDSTTHSCASAQQPTCPTLTTNTTMDGIPVRTVSEKGLQFAIIPSLITTYNNSCVAPAIISDGDGGYMLFYIQDYTDVLDYLENNTEPQNGIKFSPQLQVCANEKSSFASMTPAALLSWYQTRLQADGNSSLATDIQNETLGSDGFYIFTNENGLVFRWMFGQSYRCPITCQAGEYLYSDDNYNPVYQCHTCDGEHCCLSSAHTYTASEYTSMGMYEDLCPTNDTSYCQSVFGPGYTWDSNDGECVGNNDTYCVNTYGSGYTWDNVNKVCVSTPTPSSGCPAHSSTLPSGPIAELAGTGYDFNNDGEITSNECFTARVYGQMGMIVAEYGANNVSSMFPAYSDLISLGTSQNIYDASNSLNRGDTPVGAAICFYDSATGNYDGACSAAIMGCGNNFQSMFSNTNLGPMTMLTAFAQGNEVSVSALGPTNQTVYPYTGSTIQTVDTCDRTCPAGDYWVDWLDGCMPISTQEDCEEAGYYWDNDNSTCIGQEETPQYVCESGGSVWYDDACISQEQYACEHTEGYVWYGDACIGQDQYACENAGYVWYDDNCISQEQYACENTEGYVWYDDACVSYGQYACESGDGDNVWYNNTCMGQEQYTCESAGNYWDGEDCKYSETPGYYLLYDSQNDTLTQHVQCPAGSWCPGFTNQTFADATIGINTCPNGYTNSAQGSSANTDCYRTCTNNDITHSTGTLNGGVYYNGTNGDGVNTCEPTSCVTGYHAQTAVPNLMTVIGVNEAEAGWGYLSNDGNDSYNANTYGITHNGEFVVDYGNRGRVHGYARCSTRGVTNPWYNNDNILEPDHFAEILPDSTGQYCYCQLDGYTSNGGSTVALSGPWVYNTDDSDAADPCAQTCAFFCAMNLHLPDYEDPALSYRAAMFGAYPSNPASCTANTINLNWYSIGDTVFETNQCTYDGAITLPETNPTRPGYVFAGWQLRTTPVE